MNDWLSWLGIVLCLSQSATLSGLNLAVFSVSRLRLETAAESGETDAARVLRFRRDSNYTLATILWANVAVNVLLALLSESVLAGILAFMFSTVVITVVGEILPQAYFSRNALRVASRLAPVLQFYRVLCWPLAKPMGMLLDAWIGPEGINWLRERELREVLRHHAQSAETEVSRVEATGAINFLALDDLPVGAEGEPIDARSVIRLSYRQGRPVFPRFERSPDDPFLRSLEESGKKWVAILDDSGMPHAVVDSHAFLRDALFGGAAFSPLNHVHRPLVVQDACAPLGRVLGRLTVRPEREDDDVVDEDIILLWTREAKRIITGSDILGRLLRGITRLDAGAGPRMSVPDADEPPGESCQGTGSAEGLGPS